MRFFGGAAGGGKSDALLMAALQYVDVAERDRLQPGKPVAPARPAEADRQLVATEFAAAVDPDGWPTCETCAVLLMV
jgi:hypothetical protein